MAAVPIAYEMAQAIPIDLEVKKDEAIINQDGTDCATATPVVNAMAIPGACIEYTIKVKNEGTSDVTDIVISDVLPAELNFVAFHATTSAFDSGPTEVAGVISATDNFLAANGASVQIVIRATVK